MGQCWVQISGFRLLTTEIFIVSFFPDYLRPVIRHFPKVMLYEFWCKHCECSGWKHGV